MIEHIPNTSENSLEDVQQTFESRNKLIINSTIFYGNRIK